MKFRKQQSTRMPQPELKPARTSLPAMSRAEFETHVIEQLQEYEKQQAVLWRAQQAARAKKPR